MKIALDIEEYELEQLITWHTDKQYDAAERERYDDASGHKARRLQLLEIKQRLVDGLSQGKRGEHG